MKEIDSFTLKLSFTKPGLFSYGYSTASLCCFTNPDLLSV